MNQRCWTPSVGVTMFNICPRRGKSKSNRLGRNEPRKMVDIPEAEALEGYKMVGGGWNLYLLITLYVSLSKPSALFSLFQNNLYVLVTQSCPTLWDSMDCSLPGSSVHGIFQARILEWVAISSSRGSSWPRDWTWVSCIGRQVLCHLNDQRYLPLWALVSYSNCREMVSTWCCISASKWMYPKQNSSLSS